jgi:hypothetical protein
MFGYIHIKLLAVVAFYFLIFQDVFVYFSAFALLVLMFYELDVL